MIRMDLGDGKKQNEAEKIRPEQIGAAWRRAKRAVCSNLKQKSIAWRRVAQGRIGESRAEKIVREQSREEQNGSEGNGLEHGGVMRIKLEQIDMQPNIEENQRKEEVDCEQNGEENFREG